LDLGCHGRCQLLSLNDNQCLDMQQTGVSRSTVHDRVDSRILSSLDFSGVDQVVEVISYRGK
jgi:hypothetical protein